MKIFTTPLKRIPLVVTCLPGRMDRNSIESNRDLVISHHLYY